MKLAVIAALALDRRSGVILGQPVPADQAIRTVKEAITSGRPPDPRYPILGAFDLSVCLRENRFTVTAAELAEFRENIVAPGDELNALLAANASLEEQGKRDEVRISELSALVTSREARLTELEALLKAAAQELESREETINGLRGSLTAKTSLAETLQTQLDEANASLAKALSAPPAPADQNTPPPSVGESAASPAASSDAAAGGDQLSLASSSAPTETSAGTKKKKQP